MLISQDVHVVLVSAMKDTFVQKLLSGINFSKVQLLDKRRKCPGFIFKNLLLTAYFDTVFSDLLASSAGPKTVTCCVAKSPLSS